MASVRSMLCLMVVCVLIQLVASEPWGGRGFGGGYGRGWGGGYGRGWGGGYGSVGVIGFGRRYGYGYGGYYPPPPVFYPPLPYYG